MSGRYDDIIDIERFEPKHHPRMPRINRAAQFLPFAALTGFEDEIRRASEMSVLDPETVLMSEEIEDI